MNHDSAQVIQSMLIGLVGLILTGATVIMRKTINIAHEAAMPVLEAIKEDLHQMDKKLDALSFQYTSILEKHSNLASHIADLERHYDLQAEARNTRITKLETFILKLKTLLEHKKIVISEEGIEEIL